MGFSKDFLVECIGAVTILTEDRVVFQGQIVRDEKDRHHHEEEQVNVVAKLENEPEFIELRLTCDPAIIRDNAHIEEIDPDLFEEGDIIRLNVNEIVAIGPSRECLGDGNAAAAKV